MAKTRNEHEEAVRGLLDKVAWASHETTDAGHAAATAAWNELMRLAEIGRRVEAMRGMSRCVILTSYTEDTVNGGWEVVVAANEEFASDLIVEQPSPLAALQQAQDGDNG